MLSKLLEMAGVLHGEVFFFVEDGPLRNRLIDMYLEEEEAHADILEFELETSVCIKRQEDSPVLVFEYRLEAGVFQYQNLFSPEDFDTNEIAELIDYLRPHCLIPLKKEAGSGRSILRKNMGRGLLNISAAAKALDISPRSLKALIPCSEIRIAEKSGDKTIEDYYWEKDLLDRFETLWTKQKEGCEHNSEDVAFIAECCCDGDIQWAREIIAGYLKQRRLSDRKGRQTPAGPETDEGF